MRILYVCHWNSISGFGRAARDYVSALVSAGAEIDVVDWQQMPGASNPGRPGSPEVLYRDLDVRLRAWPTGARAYDVAVLHSAPRVLASLVGPASTAQYAAVSTCATAHVAVTTWETSRFPDAFRDPLNTHFDATIVPSSYCERVLGGLGGVANVRVVPHTFDPDYWRPLEDLPRTAEGAAHDPDFWATLKRAKQRPAGPLHFYALGAWSERKNHGAILRAYLHAFTADDPVRLTILSQGVDAAQVKSLLGRSGLHPDRLPELHVEQDLRALGEIRRLHWEADVFVSASRGEGWGLPLFEAAVLGKPIIAAVSSGERDYLIDGDTGWRYSGLRPVASIQTPAFAGAGIPIAKGDQIVGERASTIPGMDCRQTWAEPDVLDLADRMSIFLAQHRDGNHIRGRDHDRALLTSRFGYRAVGPQLLSTLQEIVHAAV